MWNRNKKKIVYLIFWIVCVGQSAWAAEAPGARSPIGSPTQVPSAGRTSAIPSRPNLYGYVGNLTMTGNIGGGRHFRGFVPYGSVYYFDSGITDPDSRAVSSFIRRSAGYEPYYDPSRTVTSLQRAGVPGLSRPVMPPQGHSPLAARQWLASFDITELLRPPQQRPLAASAQSVEAILDRQITEDFLKRRTSLKEPLKTALPGIDLSLPPVTPEIPTPLEPIPKTSDQPPPAQESADLTVYERIQRELLKPSSIAPLSDQADGLTEQRQESPPRTSGPASQRSTVLLRPEEVVDPSQGRAALKDYPDYQHLAQAKAAAYLAAGETFLKQGQFYKAADAFELAFVWDRNNALHVLARSHALFAAGEYMSSAFCLQEALRQEPKLVEAGIDWAALLGSRDVFEDRLVELSTWQQRSNSAELAFLMGYVLYLDGKGTRALISAEFALDNMPDNPAVRVLHEAIDKALNPNRASAESSENP